MAKSYLVKANYVEQEETIEIRKRFFLPESSDHEKGKWKMDREIKNLNSFKYKGTVCTFEEFTPCGGLSKIKELDQDNM